MSRRHKRISSRDNNVIQLSQALVANGRAMDEGPRRKRWSRHDLMAVQPRTVMQQEMFREFMSGQNICAHGSAGTGKTFSACFLALNALLQGEFDKIIIVRSIVSIRDPGALPGTLEEKLAVYEQPYVDIFAELLGKQSSYADLKAAGIVEFHATSFLRGLTWDNTCVIVDEPQNMAFQELDTAMTRLGIDSRIIVCGDMVQNDLISGKSSPLFQSGFKDFIRVVERMNSFSSIKFTRHDIVRGPLVKAWIEACEDLGLV